MFAALLLSASALAQVPQEVIDLVTAREAAEDLFDRYEPGKWLGKQHNFEPILSWTKLGGLVGSARIRVSHVNSEEDFIEAFYAKDQDDKIVAGVMLTSTSKPDFKLEVPDSCYKLTAYAIGSQHGVWKSLTLDLSWTVGRPNEGRIMSNTPPLKEGAPVPEKPEPIKDEL